jgi:alpha-tubulin suppressor-like RCC1 family protein
LYFILNQAQLIPVNLNGFRDEKVIMISCGAYHSIALTKSGRVFSWGCNEFGQLGHNSLLSLLRNSENKPKFIEIKNNFIKISCGRHQSLLLSHEGKIYAFGSSKFGQIGNGVRRRRNSTFKIKKLIDIATHPLKHISVALSDKGKIFIWGQCGEKSILRSMKTQFECLGEVFADYFQITYKTISIEKNIGKGKYSKNFNELNLISYGSYGSVYKAMHKESRNLFAIKKILINEMSKEKVLKEVEILSKVKSEFIAALETYWVEDNYIEVNTNSSVVLF